jgi:hypothetical protein
MAWHEFQAGFIIRECFGMRPMTTTRLITRLEFESAIKQLPESEVRDIANWLQDYLDEMWDRQMAADVASGKFDRLIATAEADIAANNVRDLDEVLYDG